MLEPTRRSQLTRRASRPEAAPTAVPWMCCATAATAAAWQVALYQVAYQHAVRTVQADRLGAERARWN
jgi:hypothetical protein